MTIVFLRNRSDTLQKFMLFLCEWRNRSFSPWALLSKSARSDVSRDESFIRIVALVLLSQPLNHLASSHWTRFSSANYFDEKGLFISTVYSFPILFNESVGLVGIMGFFYLFHSLYCGNNPEFLPSTLFTAVSRRLSSAKRCSCSWVSSGCSLDASGRTRRQKTWWNQINSDLGCRQTGHGTV